MHLGGKFVNVQLPYVLLAGIPKNKLTEQPNEKFH